MKRRHKRTEQIPHCRNRSCNDGAGCSNNAHGCARMERQIFGYELSVYRSRDGFEGFAIVSRERKGF